MTHAMGSSWRICREADRITLACYCIISHMIAPDIMQILRCRCLCFLDKGEKSLPWLVIVTVSMVTDWVPMGRIRCPLRVALTSLFLCDYPIRGHFFVDLRILGCPTLREPLQW